MNKYISVDFENMDTGHRFSRVFDRTDQRTFAYIAQAHAYGYKWQYVVSQ